LVSFAVDLKGIERLAPVPIVVPRNFRRFG